MSGCELEGEAVQGDPWNGDVLQQAQHPGVQGKVGEQLRGEKLPMVGARQEQAPSRLTHGFAGKPPQRVVQGFVCANTPQLAGSDVSGQVGGS